MQTRTSISCLLGKISCTDPSVCFFNAGLGNSTRWVLDLEHIGTEGVSLSLQLLSNNGRVVVPDVISFSFGAINSNFYVARPNITPQQDGTLLLKTSSLKESVSVKYRLNLDIIHSANR